MLLVFLLLAPALAFADPDTGDVINDGHGDHAYVPAGEFLIGDNSGDGAADERPVHTVSVDAYYIGVHEVTNGEFRKFVDDGGYANKAFWSAGGFGRLGNQPCHWTNPAYKGGGLPGNDNFPVVGVSWFEARAYCAWLSAKTGITYRLPTEAEWEKAARGPDQRRYPWGEAIDESRARFFNRDNLAANGLAPVGWYDGTRRGDLLTQSNASPYGAYDMAGMSSSGARTGTTPGHIASPARRAPGPAPPTVAREWSAAAVGISTAATRSPSALPRR